MVRGTAAVKRVIWLRQILEEIGAAPEILNKEAVELGIADIRWLHTKMNTADLFTKPVSRQVFNNLIALLTGHASTEQWAPILTAAASPDKAPAPLRS